MKGTVAPPSNVVNLRSAEDETAPYAPNNMLINAQEWVAKQNVTVALTALLIRPCDGSEPQIEILQSEADITELALIGAAVGIYTQLQVVDRAIPDDDEDAS